MRSRDCQSCMHTELWSQQQRSKAFATMAMAAVAAAAARACIRNQRLKRVSTRAFRATREHRGSNSLARGLCSHPGGCGATFILGNDSSFASSSFSRGFQLVALGPKAPGFSRGFASGGEPAHEKITMPALSPTMTQGNVVQWKKNEGDKVTAGDVLCEIETDKATLDLEAMDDGFLAKIIAPAGAKDIPVGQPLCIVVEDEGDVGKFANFSGEAPAKAPSDKVPAKSKSDQPISTPKEAAPDTPSASSPAPDVPFQNIAMPALSPTMTQGNVLKWKKNEGEKVTAGDVLCEIETDKATLDMEAMEDGFLAKILVQAGSKDIPVGQPLCVVVEEEEDVDKFKNFSGQAPAKGDSKKAEDSSKSKSSGTSSSAPVSQTGPPEQTTVSTDREPAAKPAAKPDISSPPPSKPATPVSSEISYHDIPNSQIRKIIAKRLLESKTQIPHVYFNADAIVDATLLLRKELKEKYGTSISVNDFVIRAAALALRDVPEANAFWDEKSGDIVLNKSIDICVAVATDKGLMTPIVKDADKKSLSAISAEVKSLAEKARTGKLKPSEFQGGTFSISNLGMFAVDRFAAIINPPQACILAVGRGIKAVQWSEEGDLPVTVTKMGLTLSADQRVFEGDIGGRFLEALSLNLSDPKHMLL